MKALGFIRKKRVSDCSNQFAIKHPGKEECFICKSNKNLKESTFYICADCGKNITASTDSQTI